MNRRVFGVIGLWVMTLAPAVVFSQSLADTAKAEQARRKKATPAATPKVYTESDLPASPEKPAPEPEPVKAGVSPAPKKSPYPTMAELKRNQKEMESMARLVELTNLIAATEAEVQRLGKLPTGGGKVCKIPEGVFVPGVTAPSSVVCPYQMESRYDEAKRMLEEMKRELATLQAEKTHRP